MTHAELISLTIAVVSVVGGWWLNSADKITSLKVYASSANEMSFKGKITLKRLTVNI